MDFRADSRISCFFIEERERRKKTLTSIGIVQLPQYFIVRGYVTPSFGPITKCSKISVIVGDQSP